MVKRSGQDHGFSGKSVLITGASRGVGRQLALDFAAAGAKVALNYTSSAAATDEVVAEITAVGGEAFAVGADIGQSDQVAEMFSQFAERYGSVDILINNAGINRDSAFLDMSEEDWDAVMNTNLKGPFLCSQAAARMMAKQGISDGRIINISAVTSMVGRAGSANYSASKAGLNSLTRSLAIELGPNVTVNAIALGFFDSILVREVFSSEQIAAVEGKLPVRRMGQFDEISALVQYLASASAGFMTGQVVTLDGGHIIQLP